ncbi:MAG: PAS domain-containing sensor histidine kinase, partial [Planctomycetia bacterium]
GRLVVNKRDYVVAFIRDVTERRHAFEVEARLASIVRSAETAIVSVDSDLNVLTWNTAATRLFGYEKDEIIGRQITCLAPPYLMDTIYRLANMVLKQGNSLSPRKFQVIRKDGTVFFISFAASPLPDVDGNIVGISAVIRDMTPEIEAEAALQQERNALKRLLEAYDRERKLISYEIHDGLAQYIGGATMQLQALMNMSDELSESAEQILQTCYSLMHRGLRETRGLINNLRPPVLDEFGVIAGIEHMACDETDAEGFPIHFTHQVSFQRLQPLLENGIFRIVQEGISNAKKHSQADSVEVDICQKGKMIFIKIRDHGIGFDPDALTPESFGIRGIRERVRLLSGEMEIHSNRDEGTLIKVSLPVLEEDELIIKEMAQEEIDV